MAEPAIQQNESETLEASFEEGEVQAGHIFEKYPLSEAAQAYWRIASGKSGKGVLIMSGTYALQETKAVQSEALETK